MFVSGSHSEGSGYALIEAMSAGVVPVVTDIPSFRAIAGDCGARWPPGDAGAFADALLTRVRAATSMNSALVSSAQYDRGAAMGRDRASARSANTRRSSTRRPKTRLRRMKIAIVVTGGLHPSGREQVVPSWLALFSALATTHEVHAFALRHLPEPTDIYSCSGSPCTILAGRRRRSGSRDGRRSARSGCAQWLRMGPFDSSMGFWGDPAGQLAARMGRGSESRSIVTFDSGEFVSIPEIDYGSQRTHARARAPFDEA